MEAGARLPAIVSRGLETAWARGLANRPRLTPATIRAHAERRAGPAADGPWVDRLEGLCDSLNGEAALNSLGLTIAYGQLVRIVASRARAERLWREKPEILARPLPPPVAIVGQMRSGTTRVHRLLACDMDFAATRLIDTLEPVPPRWPDLRAIKARAALGFLGACNPALRAIHPTSPMAAEEDFGLHAFSLWGAQFEGQWMVPSFARCCEGEAGDEVYEEFGKLLRTIGWGRGIAPERTWLLKAPQFAQDLPAMAAAFPGLSIIRLTRDPAAVVASGASLAFQQARVQSDRAEPHAIGAEWLRKTRLREQRMADHFARCPPLVTLDYDEVTRDWRGAMERVYAALGRPLGAQAEQRMARFVERARGHRGHEYSLGQFGLDEARVAAALG